MKNKIINDKIDIRTCLCYKIVTFYGFEILMWWSKLEPELSAWGAGGSCDREDCGLRDRLPKTHKICDIKNFLVKILWFLVKNLEFGKFEILNPKISKFEILNPNTKISNLDTNFLNFDDFCYKFEENFAEIDKIGDISKFEILNPKIQNFRFRQNLTKNQNSATVVYHNFAISPKFESQNFEKICPNMG